MDEKIEIRPGRNVNILVLNNPTSTQTVFLLHGLGGRGEQWRAQYEMLKEHYTVIVPDMLGHGHSDKPESDTRNLYNFSELDQDIKTIFNRYASQQNIVMGHSYGGALATSLALAHSDRIQKLVLLSPAPLAPEMKIPFLFTLPTRVMEWLRPILEKSMARMIFTPEADPDLVRSEMLISRQNPMGVIKSTIHGFLGMPRVDVSGLQVSTLTILGSQDKLVKPGVSQQFYDVLPAHETIMLSDASHMSLLENAREVNELIWKWCRRN